MTNQVILGVCLQALAVIVVLRYVRRAWLSNPGALFILVAFAYHGLTEPVQALFPAHRNQYRRYLAQDALDRWVLVVGVAMLFFSCAYIVARGRIRQTPMATDAIRRGTPPWQLWLVAAMVSFPVVIGAQRGTSSGYWLVGLAEQFLALAVVVGGTLAILARPRLLYSMLAFQSLLLLAAGSRLEVISAAVALLACAAYVGHRPSRRGMLTMVGVGVLLTALLSNARSEIGREAFASTSATERLRLMIGSIGSMNTDAVLDDTVYRFDGNVFAGLMAGQMLNGRPGTGLQPLFNSAYRAIPSFLAPGKLQTDLTVRSEEEWLSEHFDIPIAVDFLPTTLGVLFAYRGQLGLLLFAPLLGIAFGRTDRWLHAKATPIRMIVLIGMVEAIATYEQGTEIWFTTARAALSVAMIVIAWSMLRGAPSPKVAPPRTASAPLPPIRAWGIAASRRNNHQRH